MFSRQSNKCPKHPLHSSGPFGCSMCFVEHQRESELKAADELSVKKLPAICLPARTYSVLPVKRQENSDDESIKKFQERLRMQLKFKRVESVRDILKRLSIVLLMVILASGCRGNGEQVDVKPEKESLRFMLVMHNQARSKENLAALRENVYLHGLAQSHAEAMARSGIISHHGAGDGSFGERIRDLSGVTRAGENIAAGQRDASQAFNAWMNSSGHRSNIMGKFNQVGFGAASSGSQKRIYWCVIFVYRENNLRELFLSERIDFLPAPVVW